MSMWSGKLEINTNFFYVFAKSQKDSLHQLYFLEMAVLILDQVSFVVLQLVISNINEMLLVKFYEIFLNIAILP